MLLIRQCFREIFPGTDRNAADAAATDYRRKMHESDMEGITLHVIIVSFTHRRQP